MTPRIAVCPGSFDPLTLGHVAVIRHALRLFDQVIVALSVNPRKQSLFSFEERSRIIRESFQDDPRVTTEALSGLLVAWTHTRGAVAIVRGLRAATDFEYEVQMAHMNQHLYPDITTLFVPTDPDQSFISSSLVKEVAALGGDVQALLPPPSYRALSARLGPTSPHE